MPLAGLILNRTHPMLSSLAAEKATEAADAFGDKDSDLTAGVLRIHADRAERSKREIRLLSRCCRGSPAPIRTSRLWACRRCRSTCRIWRHCGRSPTRSPARPRPSAHTGGRLAILFRIVAASSATVGPHTTTSMTWLARSAMACAHTS
jgi:hypothetical protein